MTGATSYPGALPVPGGELLGDPRGLGVADARGEAAPALGVGELGPLRRQLALRRRERLTALPHGDLELHQRRVQTGGSGSLVRGKALAGEQAVEPGAEFVESHRTMQAGEIECYCREVSLGIRR